MRAVLFICFALLAACDDSSSAVKENVPSDAGGAPLDSGASSDGGGLDGGGAADCVMNPKTHAEIINACTDAVKIAKNPSLPKLLADGGLPPLQ